MEPDWVQLLVTVPAVVAVIWAVYRFTLERQAKQEEERKQLSALYINPFLLACEELQSRIFNILERGGLGPPRAQDPERVSYAEETLYLIAQYFGWERHIFRYGPYVQDTEAFRRTEAIRAIFATNRVGHPESTRRGGGVPFRFFRYQQKALAQIILETTEGPTGLEAETITYFDFWKLHPEPLATLPAVNATLDALRLAEFPHSLAPDVQGRLAEVQNHLVMLLAYLEEKEEFTLFLGDRELAERHPGWIKWAKNRNWDKLLGKEDQATGKDSETDRRPKGERLMPEVIVFDVNETLLDLAALDPRFEESFGDTSARQEWFAQVLQSALALTVGESYVDFGRVGAAALEMTADRRGISLSDSDRDAILAGMRSLPPYPEVPESLERLRAAGIKLAALTNSTAEVAEAQLTNAGLIEYFDRVLSVDSVRRFKPAIETYRMAARELGVEASDLLLVAAHDWDVAGALRAGWAAAFVARPGMVLGPLGEQPDIVGQDLREVADQILGE